MTMEWVEISARTVEEAKDQALDRLGVAEDEAEFEVLEEPRPGLFGRLRGQARVRARVRPTQPRAKAERRDSRRSKPRKEGEPAATTAAAKPRAASTKGKGRKTQPVLDDAADAAPLGDDDGTGLVATRAARPPRAAKTRAESDSADSSAQRSAAPKETRPMNGSEEKERALEFLSGLADAFGYPATTTFTENDGELEVQLLGDELGPLIGPRGQTLQAIQELTRLVAQPSGSDRAYRLHVDVGGYRERRREALVRFTNQVASQVKESGERRILEPMSAPDRKVVHDTVGTIDGVASRSEGEDERRHVIIEPA
jgi:spoIIIJ-associated protein